MSDRRIQLPYCATVAVTALTCKLSPSGVTPSVMAVSAFGSGL